MPTPSAAYAAVRFYLLLGALIEGAVRPSQAELDWAIDLLDTLDLPEQVINDAEADHHQMLAHAHGGSPSPSPGR